MIQFFTFIQGHSFTEVRCAVVFFGPCWHDSTQLLSTSNLKHLYNTGWINAFTFMPNSDPIIQLLQQKSTLVRPSNVFLIFCCQILMNLCELRLQFPVLIWQEWHMVWSSALVTHLFQGSTRFSFRDTLLQTLAIVSGYLSLCCHPISSKQPGYSPLNSGISI